MIFYFLTPAIFTLKPHAPFELQDVAYSLTTSLESGLLDSIDEFVDFYFERLRGKLSSLNLTPPPPSFRSHFDVCWLDYARVVLFGLWRRLSHEQVNGE